jgi:septal ring factor EnvC (AmiA/AmiB activator)
MNRRCLRVAFALAVLLAMAPMCARGQNQDYLTSAEVDKLRDAQDPSERIKVYLSFQQERLGRMEIALEAHGDTKDNVDDLLNEYISIDNELKDWVQYQFDHDGDMRKGLRALLDEGPKQLEVLRHFQSSPDVNARDFSSSLHDAIADMNDTLDGATQALAVQQKKFPEMAQSAKTEARELKKERKEQKKLNKKERKTRNRHRKTNNPDDSGEN